MGENWEVTLSQAVREGNSEKTQTLVKNALNSAIRPRDILEQGLIPGVQALGELFKDGEVFLPDVLISVRAMNMGLDILKPLLDKADIAVKGKVVLGTVEGDIHDIGKDLVGMMLRSNGYEVIDVGINVAADVFVNAARENAADIIGMSALLTTTMPYFSTVIEKLRDEGLRDNFKVMIGGASVSREYADAIDAEGFAEDCVSAVDEANRLMSTR